MILHIDMDAFYASVEELDNPRLRGTCVIVAGRSERSVVAAASYEARTYGVHSAMPVFQARKKCPQAIIIPPRMDRYREVSKLIMDILREFSPLVEPVSIDEAYVDVTGCERLFGGVRDIALAIKRRIVDSVHLGCSVGAAPAKYLAKIASDMDKPDGLTIIMPEQVASVIETLPVGKVPGVGTQACERLRLLGIRTLGDVKKFPEEVLVNRFGKFGRRLSELADGIDRSPVTPCRETKSVSAEETFAEDTEDRKILKKYILKQAERVGRELRNQHLHARTISIKIKHSDFTQITRSTTMKYPTHSTEVIIREALHLLDNYRLPAKVRLIGVGASHILSDMEPAQRELFEEKDGEYGNWEKLDDALDNITDRFGPGMVTRGTLKEKG